MTTNFIDFNTINQAALAALPRLLPQWLPDGRAHNGEWMARNPTRNDRKPGSFLINLATGRWADFATGDRGGDVVSLVAYLTGKSQFDAATDLSNHLGANHV